MTTPTSDSFSTDRETVLEYLTARGILTGVGGAQITELTGGVSGDAILVEAGEQRVVVKRALNKLRVRSEWLAKPERALTEAAAIDVLHRITPDQTPELLDLDPERFTLVMSAANPSWTSWKARLLHDRLDATVELAVGRTLGAVLGTWHLASSGSQDIADRFDDREAFEQLRIGPFHRVVAQRHPHVAAAIGVCIDDLQSRRDCLVHGDYSPKNVLVGPAALPGLDGRDGLMVLDFEVACYGAAVFDVAYLHCHLILKAMHRPDQRHLFRQIGDAFLDAYTSTVKRDAGPLLGWHTACLLLARVDGTSPSGYLNSENEARVRRLALRMLEIDQPALDEVWDAAQELIEHAGGPRQGNR